MSGQPQARTEIKAQAARTAGAFGAVNSASQTYQPWHAAACDIRRVLSYDISEIIQITIGELEPSADDPFERDQDVSDLAASIQARGVLRPLLVSTKPGLLCYQVVCGSRRLIAARAAGMKCLPCIIRTIGRMDLLLLRVTDNLCTERLSKLEEARGYRALCDMGFSQREISRCVERSAAHICRRLRLLTLPPSVQERVEHRQLSVDRALGYDVHGAQNAPRPPDLLAAWQELRQAILRIGDDQLNRRLSAFALEYSRQAYMLTNSVPGRPAQLRADA